MLILPQIVYNELDVFYLAGCQTGYVQHLRGAWLLHFPPQQIIGADVKEICNSYQHFYGRHDIVIFPITVNANQKMSIFAGMECHFSPVIM